MRALTASGIAALGQIGGRSSPISSRHSDRNDNSRNVVVSSSASAAAAAATATASDVESDLENTTFRAASSDGWDPNDSHISGSIGTYEDGFVVHHSGVGDVGQPKQTSSTTHGSYNFEDIFPSSRPSANPKPLLTRSFVTSNEGSDTDDTRPDWRKALLGYISDSASSTSER